LKITRATLRTYDVLCNVGEQKLTDYCKKHLASFKVPKSFVFIDALPRNAMGKSQLQDLPDWDRL
jgi:acyl-CoA synthetase (AMP-forming)/AMP-acid ligase II